MYRSYFAVSQNGAQFVLPLRQKLHIRLVKKKIKRYCQSRRWITAGHVFHCALWFPHCFLQCNFYARQSTNYLTMDAKRRRMPRSVGLSIAIFNCPFAASILINEAACVNESALSLYKLKKLRSRDNSTRIWSRLSSTMASIIRWLAKTSSFDE